MVPTKNIGSRSGSKRAHVRIRIGRRSSRTFLFFFQVSNYFLLCDKHKILINMIIIRLNIFRASKTRSIANVVYNLRISRTITDSTFNQN